MAGCLSSSPPLTRGPIHLRPARVEECRAIAELFRMASSGVADYIWTGLAQPGEDLIDAGARRYRRENTDFSYQNVTVAVTGNEIAGMVAAYMIGPRSVADADHDMDPVLLPYARLEQPDSFYIAGMAVFPGFRGAGIGTRLIDAAAERGHAAGTLELSLIVFEKNFRARRLYERCGFREIARERVVPHPLIACRGDALLMTRPL